MSTVEIVILIIGIAVFVVSFFIPDKKSSISLNGDVDEEAIRAAIREEVNKFKSTLNESCEDIINENKDNMERFMDRLTNEKMLAVSEYSDTVLERIHKNHEEAVFLYDMLNNKHTQVKDTAAKINEIEKESKKADSTEAGTANQSRLLAKTSPATEPKQKAPARESVKEFKPEIIETPEPEKPFKALDIPVVQIIPEATEPIDLMFAPDGDDTNGEKAKIIALHKLGKSNMAIAKELGLGIGEVKLVLDLYK